MYEVELAMNAVEELEPLLTLDQARCLADFDPPVPADAASSTQQVLDDLLGRFEDDDSTMLLAHGLTLELYADSDE